MILDADAVREELLGQLLEWNPIVMASLETFAYLSARQIKVDVLLSSPKGMHYEEAYEMEVIPCDPNALLETALSYLERRHQDSVYILWNDFSPQEILPFLDRYSIAIFSKDTKFIFTAKYHKWLIRDTMLILPQGLADVCISKELERVSNKTIRVVNDGFVTLSNTNSRLLCIGEQI